MAYAQFSPAICGDEGPNRKTRRHAAPEVCAGADFWDRRSAHEQANQFCWRDSGDSRIGEVDQQWRVRLRFLDVSNQHRRFNDDRRCRWNHATEKHMVRAEAARCDVLSPDLRLISQASSTALRI